MYAPQYTVNYPLIHYNTYHKVKPMQKRIPCIYTYGKGSFKIAVYLAYVYLYMWHMHIYVCVHEGGKREPKHGFYVPCF